MSGTPLLKRLLDAGMQFTEMSQATAEKLVGEFVKSGQLRRKDAEKTVSQLVDRGRSTTEHVVAAVQSEVSKQMGRMAGQIAEIEERLEEVAQSVGLKSKPPAAPVKDAAPVKKAAPANKLRVEALALRHAAKTSWQPS